MKRELGVITCLLFSALQGSANMGPQGFHKYKNRIFVETGTFGGDGIQLALDAGFEEVRSMEINPIAVQDAKKRYLGNSKVAIHLKDSGAELYSVIADIEEPVTFWLDAHNGFPDPNAKDVKNTPLMEELEQIKMHPIKTHTIIIDDMHCCDTLLFDYIKRDEIVAKLLEINPAYAIEFVPGGDAGEYPHNVLVARIVENENSKL